MHQRSNANISTTHNQNLTGLKNFRKNPSLNCSFYEPKRASRAPRSLSRAAALNRQRRRRLSLTDETSLRNFLPHHHSHRCHSRCCTVETWRGCVWQAVSSCCSASQICIWLSKEARNIKSLFEAPLDAEQRGTGEARHAPNYSTQHAPRSRGEKQQWKKGSPPSASRSGGWCFFFSRVWPDFGIISADKAQTLNKKCRSK